MSDIRENVTSKLAALTIFKPVPGGYVYCAPDRVFGPSRCYLVNEAQKAEIIALTTPRRPILWQVMLWLVFTLFVLATVLIMSVSAGASGSMQYVTLAKAACSPASSHASSARAASSWAATLRCPGEPWTR